MHSSRFRLDRKWHPPNPCPKLTEEQFRMHREESGVDGDQDFDRKDDHGVRCGFCTRRGWNEAIDENTGAFYAGARPYGLGLHEQELKFDLHQMLFWLSEWVGYTASGSESHRVFSGAYRLHGPHVSRGCFKGSSHALLHNLIDKVNFT